MTLPCLYLSEKIGLISVKREVIMINPIFIIDDHVMTVSNEVMTVNDVMTVSRSKLRRV